VVFAVAFAFALATIRTLGRTVVGPTP
jgi:hypothetical protein